MKRVYTDDRFPGVEIVNEGTPLFQVTKSGKVTGRYRGFEQLGAEQVSESFAQRRAQSYFDLMAESGIGRGDLAQPIDLPEGTTVDDVLHLMLEAKPEMAARLRATGHRLIEMENPAQRLVEALIG